MATNNFEHIYSECRDHIYDLRPKDFVNELDALAGMAKDPKQSDRVIGLFMAGILSGAIGNNLSR